MKFMGILLVILLAANFVNAAAVQGTVYSISLDILENAVVQIDTEPKQIKVANDGTYQFSVEPGNYIIRAAFSNDEQYYYEENISIKDAAGVYNIDLILLPDIDDEDIEDVEELLGDIAKDKKQGGSNTILYIIISAAVLIAVAFYLKRKSKYIYVKDEIKTEQEEDLEKIVEFIKKHDGRATQKDIRKEFPYSEAKISLIITELEDKGIVKKIKKGRGNVIILQR